MATRPRVLSLCAGIGGIDLALRDACGARTVGYVERDAYAASVLVARMADAHLDPAPVWDDLATFDGRPWRGRVDLVAAGIPCQPFSVAGKRRGLADERWLWSDVLRIIDDTAATALFLENVGGFTRHGLGRVLTDLAARGFSAEWGHFRASDVGAPHRRERFFLLAHADGAGFARQRIAEHAGLEGTRGGVTLGCDQHGRLGWPPARNDADGWREWIEAGGPEPAVRRGSHGIRSRVDRLRCLGNAVVPEQAALAFGALRARLRESA